MEEWPILCLYYGHRELSSYDRRIVNIVPMWLKLLDSKRIHMVNMQTKFEKDNSKTFGEIADNVFVVQVRSPIIRYIYGRALFRIGM